MVGCDNPASDREVIKVVDDKRYLGSGRDVFGVEKVLGCMFKFEKRAVCDGLSSQIGALHEEFWVTEAKKEFEEEVIIQGQAVQGSESESESESGKRGMRRNSKSWGAVCVDEATVCMEKVGICALNLMDFVSAGKEVEDLDFSSAGTGLALRIESDPEGKRIERQRQVQRRKLSW